MRGNVCGKLTSYGQATLISHNWPSNLEDFLQGPWFVITVRPWTIFGPILPRNGWLRSKLEEEGANVNKTGGCIVIRAGAIGECCGIEETLLALADLPEDVIFLMMGR